jgi:hypothetical protein
MIRVADANRRGGITACGGISMSCMKCAGSHRTEKSPLPDLLVFNGVNWLKEKKMRVHAIQDALEHTKSIVNAVRTPLVILYEDLTVALVNSSLCQTFLVKPGETENQHLYEIGDRQWDIPKLEGVAGGYPS